MTARISDENGFITINRNPISRSGIFQYLARSVDPSHPEPDSIVNVYRPDSELADPEAINSFKLIPIVDDHTMLGDDADGMQPAEKKGVHGTTGDDIVFENGTLLAKIKLFSQTLRDMIKSGKKDLSLGYRCEYTKSSGNYDGQEYQYIQRKMRGNHLALVDQARCNVSVLDGKTSQSTAFDHFDLALTEDEKKELTMADEDKKKDEEKKAMDARMAKVCDWAEKCMEKDAAEEEKKKKDGEDKAAKDAAEEEEKKKKEKEAEDAKGKDGEEKEKEKEKAMDAAITSITADVASLKSGAFTKAMLTHVKERDALAEHVSRYVGAFDAADKTLGEVAAYGVEKLKLQAPKGQEFATLTGYLNGMDAARNTGTVTIDRDDTASGGKTDAFLKKFGAA